MEHIAAFSFLLEFRAGICDGDESAAGLVRADRLFYAFKEILFEDVGLECRSGFARNNEKRSCKVNFFFERLNLRWICGIKNVQAGEALDVTIGFFKHFRAKTGSTHAEQKNVGEIFLADLLREVLELIFLLELFFGDIDRKS